ncbi:MAG: MFS transporter [Zoogloea sp.]|nr:MFS transporter [Zoogloea sp.]
MSRSIAAMAGIAVVMVLIALDQTVVGTALPKMVAELQGFRLYPWVAAAYLLTNAILIPVTGRLGDLHGRKPYLLAAIALFTLASALCGMAGSMLQLVLARGLQGIGGGMLVGSAFASVSDLFPATLERVRWQVMLSAAFGIASALGPVLGGWMTEHLGWRSVFYVNLPVGLLALPIVWRFLPRVVHGEGADKAIDWLGVLLLTLAIGTLLMTTELGEQLGFASAPFWGLVALSIVLGWLFLRHQHTTPAPIIPPRLLADVTVRRLGLLAALTGLIMFVLLFYAPLLLQGGFSLSPKDAGVLVTPLLVCITVGSIINGRLIPRMAQPERLFSRGVLFLIAGMGMLCVVSATTPWQMLAAVFALCGLSLGFQLPNLTLQMQSAVGREDQGAASALIQTLRTLGSMFGASLAGLMVSLGFSRGVAGSLAQEGIKDPAVWRLFDSPQLLVRGADQEVLAGLGHRQGFDAVALLAQARLGLVNGIREAIFGCLVLAVISYFVGRRLPPFAHKRHGT